jgi:hypothetical protein
MNFYFVTDGNGRLIDSQVQPDLEGAGAAGIDHVFIGVHGWTTTDADFMAFWDRFELGMAQAFTAASRYPSNALCIALHWPSSLSENQVSLLNLANLATFYAMEARADQVGRNAGLTLLQTILKAANGRRIAFHLFGHSFGCKVVMSTLTALAQSLIPIPAGTTFDAILMQAAFENDALQVTGPYGASLRLPLQILATISGLDGALNGAFVAASSVNWLKADKDRLALGGTAGPTPATRQQWGDRLSVFDLTAIHRATPGFDGPAGHHSDVFHPELYSRAAAACRFPAA